MELFKGKAKGMSMYIRDWDEPEIRDFDGEEIEGRPTRAFGTSEFTYAGKVYKPEPWENEWGVEDLKKYLEQWLKVEFTFCLCGLYEHSWDTIPHHSDTVPTLDDIVVGVSFGAPRILEWMQYRSDIKKETNTSKTHFIKYDESIEDRFKPVRINYLLEDGDVYVFNGHSQMNTTNSIPALEGTGARVSLTFRTGI